MTLPSAPAATTKELVSTVRALSPAIAVWTALPEPIATSARPGIPSQSLSLPIAVSNSPHRALHARAGIGTARRAAPPAKPAPLDFSNRMLAPRQTVQNAFQVRARLVLAVAASVICAHRACSPTSLAHPNALIARKGKGSPTKTNLDVSHAMQGSIRTTRLKHFATSEFLLNHDCSSSTSNLNNLNPPFSPTVASRGDTSLPATVPNAGRANGDSTSQELERLAA